MSQPARRRRTAPEDVAEPTPSIGHNRPQPLTTAEIIELLNDDFGDLIKRRDELLAGAQRFNAANAAIKSEEVCGKAADFAGSKGAMGSFLARSENRREEAKSPYLEGGRTVDSWFAMLTKGVKDARQEILGKVTAYLKAEEAAKKAETLRQAQEAARLAAIAEEQAMKTLRAGDIDRAADAAARAEQAERQTEQRPSTRVSGSFGGDVGLRGTWKFIETESNLMELARAVVEGKAPIAYLAFNTSRIGFAVRSEKVRAIPGCVIREERNAT